MPDKTLCVGGPRDGKFTDSRTPYMVAPLALGPTELYDPSDDQKPVPNRLFSYGLHLFRTQDGGCFVYAPVGWSDLQVINALIEGYRP